MPINSSYSLSDTIPFHIQVLGSFETLKELFPPSSGLLQPVQDDDTRGSRGDFAFEVYLARQVTVDIRGQKSSRTSVIGTGVMWPVPPTYIEAVPSAPDNVCLDWEGEVKCSKEVSCGGFFVGSLHVKVSLAFILILDIRASRNSKT